MLIGMFFIFFPSYQTDVRRSRSLYPHHLCVDECPDVVELLFERRICLYLLLDLLTRMDNGGVVAPPELFPYRGVGNTEFFTEHVHDYLARLHDLLLAGL